MKRLTTATDFDCGDGVPDLPLESTDPWIAAEIRDRPKVAPATAVMTLVAFGQLVLLLAVLVGGAPLVAAIAGVALLACGLTMLGIRKARTALDEP